MHPRRHEKERPQVPACLMAETGERLTFGELEDRANQTARLLRRFGLAGGDAVAFLMENSPRYYEALWGAQRAGARFTCLSTKLSAAEAAYILSDCGAKLLLVSRPLLDLAIAARAGSGRELPILVADGAAEGFEAFEAARDAEPARPIDDEAPGQAMLYSSGTTGRPKGVRRRTAPDAAVEAPHPLALLGAGLYGLGPDTVFLSPAPLYHAAPLGWSMGVQSLGGTVVLMERFDAEGVLQAVERHRVTAAQFVPTHFVRMLKLPEAVRARYDLSSLKVAFHAAAPCPVPVKRAMMAWWGPILHEYYAGTEGNGLTAIGPDEWLAHEGSVGRGVTAEVRICDEEGRVLPPGVDGLVYFAGGGEFEYHGDPQKTAETRHPEGWSTLGDVGHLDADGYLYLTDRKSFMIISGGVNIYPAEIENLLVTHPKVLDAAVVGAPHEEMGEEVVAVVQAAPGVETGPELAAELTAFARTHLSHVKTPRRIDFVAELPRHATGKLYKRRIRDAYWGRVPVEDSDGPEVPAARP